MPETETPSAPPERSYNRFYLAAALILLTVGTVQILRLSDGGIWLALALFPCAIFLPMAFFLRSVISGRANALLLLPLSILVALALGFWCNFGYWLALNTVPAAFFLILAFVFRLDRTKWTHALALLLGALLLAGYAFVSVGLEFWITETATVTDVDKYADILHKRWSQALVAHFPREVPANAELVRFSFQPMFLQGGGHIQLRLRLPEAEIAALAERFAPTTTKTFSGGDISSHRSGDDGMPTTYFYTGDAGRTFPDDYKILIFDRVPTTPEERKQLLHRDNGDSHGVAISVSRREIVYWAESW